LESDQLEDQVKKKQMKWIYYHYDVKTSLRNKLRGGDLDWTDSGLDPVVVLSFSGIEPAGPVHSLRKNKIWQHVINNIMCILGIFGAPTTYSTGSSKIIQLNEIQVVGLMCHFLMCGNIMKILHTPSILKIIHGGTINSLDLWWMDILHSSTWHIMCLKTISARVALYPSEGWRNAWG